MICTLIQITIMVLVSGIGAQPSITVTITTMGDTCCKKKHGDSFLENDESHGHLKKRKERKKVMGIHGQPRGCWKYCWFLAKDYKQWQQQQAPLIVLLVEKVCKLAKSRNIYAFHTLNILCMHHFHSFCIHSAFILHSYCTWGPHCGAEVGSVMFGIVRCMFGIIHQYLS